MVYYAYFGLASCAKKPTGNESIMSLQCKPLLQPSPKFESWMQKRLEGVGAIGPSAAIVTPAQANNRTPVIQPSSQNSNDIKDLVAAVKVVNEGLGTVSAQSSRGSKAKPTTISSRKAWRLAGLCHILHPGQTPRVWIEMVEVTTYGDALDVLVDAIVREDELLNAGIQPPTYFESQIKRLLTFEFAPNEAYSGYNAHEAVMGFRDLLPKSEKEVRKKRQHDKTLNSTPEDARTYDLMERLNEIEKGQRGFTVDREEFRETLTDYGINRRVLFTSGCPHYAAVWEIRRLLKRMTRAQRIKLLTPLALCILQFRIEEDWFWFCRQKTKKADITGAVPKFPKSYLMSTVEDLDRHIVHVPATFPRDQLELLKGASVPTDTEGRHIVLND